MGVDFPGEKLTGESKEYLLAYRELQAACKRLGLRAVGKKAELRNRLENHVATLGGSPVSSAIMVKACGAT